MRTNSSLKLLLRTLVIITITFSALSLLLSDRFHIFDLFSHFQLQFLLLFLGLHLLAVIFEDNISVAITIVYPLMLIISFVLPISVGAFQKSDYNADIMSINSFGWNVDPSTVLNEIDRIDPGTLVILEVTPELVDELNKRYTSPLVYHEQDYLSCAIYQADPADKLISAYAITNLEYPICIAEFEEYTLIAIHPTPPFSETLFDAQSSYFRNVNKIIEKVVSENKNFVLVGDFNSTYYSGLYRKYFGKYFRQNNYTWNINSPLTIPIDHALSNLDITVKKTRPTSSDHLGLVIGISEN